MRTRRRAAAAACGLLIAAGLGAQEPPGPAGTTSGPLTLEQALELALRHNEVPAIAAARIDGARAFRRQALSVLFPSLTLTGTYTRRAEEVTREVNGEELVIQARDGLLGTALAEGTLFDIRALPLVQSAGHGLDAQRLDSAELVRALRFDVAEGFLAVLSAERLSAAAARRVQVAEATVNDASIRREAGLANLNDVTRSELELASARLAATQAQNAVVATRLALGYLLGIETTGGLQDPLLPSPAAAAAADLERQALGARADLQALAARAEALRLLALEPRLRVFPSLEYRGTYRTTNETGLSGREEDWNLAAVLTWELFDGGERRALAELRRAEHREALLQVEAFRRRIGLEVRSALADLETARAALGQAEVRARVAAQNAEEVRERFANGLATALEQADSIVAAFEAETELERQRFALQLADLALARAVGRAPGADPAPAPAVASSPEIAR
jgi:outer membrane protein TolC